MLTDVWAGQAELAQKAKEAWGDVVACDPSHEEARYNLALLLLEVVKIARNGV